MQSEANFFLARLDRITSFSFIEIHKLVAKSVCKDNYEIFSMYGLQQIYIAKKVNILIQKIGYEIVY